MTTVARNRVTGGSLRAERHREAAQGYIFILPWFASFIFFTCIPMLASLYLSMTRYTISRGPFFIGIENYIVALTDDSLFYHSLIRTAVWILYTVPLGLIGSLVAAILLNQNIKGTSIYRTCFFLPSLTPVAATAMLWKWILHGDVGVMNWFLSLIGLPKVGWLATTRWVLPSMGMIALWNGIGGGRMLIFLASLQSVPKEMYEAAEIDGANSLIKHLSITIPLISPAIFFNLVMGILSSFQAFGLVFLTTAGGPVRASYLFALHIYYVAFGYFEMGYASALSWIMFLIVVLITIIQFKGASMWVYYESKR